MNDRPTLDRQLNSIATHLRHATETPCLLIAAADDAGVKAEVTGALRRLLGGQFARLAFNFTPENLNLRGDEGRPFAHFTLSPFGMNEMCLFARQWALAYERQAGDTPEAVRRAEEEARRLTAAVEAKASVRRLAANPLLLTIIALIHRQGTRLPEHRVKLYDLVVDTLLETWSRARRLDGQAVAVEPLASDEALKVLAPLALWMRENRPSGTAHLACCQPGAARSRQERPPRWRSRQCTPAG